MDNSDILYKKMKIGVSPEIFLQTNRYIFNFTTNGEEIFWSIDTDNPSSGSSPQVWMYKNGLLTQITSEEDSYSGEHVLVNFDDIVIYDSEKPSKGLYSYDINSGLKQVIRSGENRFIPTGQNYNSTILWVEFEAGQGKICYIKPEVNPIVILPPRNLTVSEVPSDLSLRLKLSWDPSPSEQEGMVIYYRIFRSESNVFESKNTVLIDSLSAGNTDFIDNSVIAGTRYYYWIQAVASVFNESSKVQTLYIPPTSEVENNLMDQFKLYEPYPNPFNQYTTIKYKVPFDCNVELIIYDILGRKISVLQNGKVSSGVHNNVWDGKNENGIFVSSGTYFYLFKANKNIIKGKILLMK